MSETSADGCPTPGGATTMSESVVAGIAALAARTVTGVLSPEDHPTGERHGPPRAVVHLGPTDAVVDVSLVASHGVDLAQLTTQVRRTVATSVREMTDLRVTAVNVTVVDVR